MDITLIVNGTERRVVADPAAGLLDVLRDELGYTGPKLGCGEGACGACTVLIGRRAVTACSTPAAEVAGQRITTVEGLAEDGLLHPVQQAWLETGAMQCGYCTPGWLMATDALLAATPHPDEARITAELAGTHYAEHAERPFFGDLVAFISRSPSMIMVVEGPNDDTFAVVRLMMGVTDPSEAAPGTIRGDFGLLTTENLVHGSDSPESAEREIALFFPQLSFP